MKLHTLLDTAYQTFREQSSNARVTLLHPNSRYRSLLVAKLLSTPDLNVYYYALGPDDIEVLSFLSGITHDIANQNPMFGRHINMLTPEAYSSSEVLLDTFAQDLADLDQRPYFLILDEYDRSDSADDVQMFIERLVTRLPENCRLVINSRTLPRLPWVSMIAQRSAVLLEDARIIRSNFYDTSEDGKNLLEVYALGPGFVLMDGNPIDMWEGHLPRLLFFFALDRPVITRSEICQAFWPELDTDQAVNVFHVTKRRLHKALDMDVLVHEDGYYSVNPELGVHYDVMHFVSYLMDGRDETKSETDRIKAWQRAIDIYRGPFLQGHADPWITDRRRDFRAGYLEALSNMANVRLHENRPENALTLLLKALTEDPMHEVIHRQVMRLYVSLGRRSEAAGHYQQKIVEEFKRQNLEPSEETHALYHEIIS